MPFHPDQLGEDYPEQAVKEINAELGAEKYIQDVTSRGGNAETVSFWNPERRELYTVLKYFSENGLVCDDIERPEKAQDALKSLPKHLRSFRSVHALYWCLWAFRKTKAHGSTADIKNPLDRFYHNSSEETIRSLLKMLKSMYLSLKGDPEEPTTPSATRILGPITANTAPAPSMDSTKMAGDGRTSSNDPFLSDSDNLLEEDIDGGLRQFRLRRHELILVLEMKGLRLAMPLRSYFVFLAMMQVD